MLSEGVGEVGGSVSILNGAPHPNAALLWARWAISEEGQNIYAQAGETPAHPNVEPTEKTRPAAIYLLSATDHPSHESTELQCDPRILEVFWTNTWLADFRWLREAQFARYTKNYLQLMKLNFHGQWSIVFIKYYI